MDGKTEVASAATSDETLGEGGKKALSAERDARKAAEKALADMRGEFEAFKTSMSEQISKLTEDRDASALKALRGEILHASGVPDRLAAYVQGKTKEELEASAKQVLADFTPPTSTPSGQQETQPAPTPLGMRPDMTQGSSSDLPLNGDPLTEALTAALGITQTT